METTNEISSEGDRRLWIGNLDPRITEFQLLKLLQKHGTIEKFDLLFHRSGPQIGQPRGYAFVTYFSQVDASSAMKALHNKRVGEKTISVTWAHSITTEQIEKPKIELNIPALSMSKSNPKTDRESKIQAIEAKLKLMTKKEENELMINDTVATKPAVIAQFQYNKQQQSSNNTNNGGNLKLKNNSKHYNNSKYNKPYSKNKNRR